MVVRRRNDAVLQAAAALPELPLDRFESEGGGVVVRSQRGAAGRTVSVQGRRRLSCQRAAGPRRLAPGGLREGLGGSGRGLAKHREVLLQ